MNEDVNKMKRSAGVIAYKIENKKIKVLLCHFGGPYWQNIDKGAWSFPKGECFKKEKAIETAKREFEEETNLKITTNIDFLSSKKVNNKKLVIMFYTNSNFELQECKSNYFELEFPKNSGNIQTFPEMDQYKWIDIEVSKKMIVKNQRYFLEKLEEKLKQSKTKIN